MSASNRSCENLPPFFLSPRLANTRNQSQLVLGMLLFCQPLIVFLLPLLPIPPFPFLSQPSLGKE
jgi:hypothetical protein